MFGIHLETRSDRIDRRHRQRGRKLARKYADLLVQVVSLNSEGREVFDRLTDHVGYWLMSQEFGEKCYGGKKKNEDEESEGFTRN